MTIPFSTSGDSDDYPTRPPQGEEPGTPDSTARPSGPLRMVAPPDEPYINAQIFLSSILSRGDVPLLKIHLQCWRRWDGAAWPELDEEEIVAAIYEFFGAACFVDKAGELRRFKPNQTKVNHILHALRSITHLPSTVSMPCWLDDPTTGVTDLVAMENGILHVPTRQLMQPTPEFFVAHSLPFAYSPVAPVPHRWLGMLNDQWADDPESIKLLQEFIGYVVFGDRSYHVIFLCQGPPRSGKSIIWRIAEALVGPANTAAPTLASLATDFGLQSLIGKRLAVIGDARLGGRADSTVVTERLLSISGQDAITADRKYRSHWTGVLDTAIVINTNETPHLRDASGALASRFLVLETTKSFLGHEDRTLLGDLLAELPGILNWALDGYDRLRLQGRFTVPTSSEQTKQQLEDLASPIRAFVRDRCELGSDFVVPIDSLYDAWDRWCREQGREHVSNQGTFTRDLTAAFPTLKKSQRRIEGDRPRVFTGIQLMID